MAKKSDLAKYRTEALEKEVCRLRHEIEGPSGWRKLLATLRERLAALESDRRVLLSLLGRNVPLTAEEKKRVEKGLADWT